MCISLWSVGRYPFSTPSKVNFHQPLDATSILNINYNENRLLNGTTTKIFIRV